MEPVADDEHVSARPAKRCRILVRAEVNDFERNLNTVERREVVLGEVADRDDSIGELRRRPEEGPGAWAAEIVAADGDDVQVGVDDAPAEPDHPPQLGPGKDLRRFEDEIEPRVGLPMLVVEPIAGQLIGKELPGLLGQPQAQVVVRFEQRGQMQQQAQREIRGSRMRRGKVKQIEQDRSCGEAARAPRSDRWDRRRSAGARQSFASIPDSAVSSTCRFRCSRPFRRGPNEDDS